MGERRGKKRQRVNWWLEVDAHRSEVLAGKDCLVSIVWMGYRSHEGSFESGWEWE
jgi:hypothetical protein